MQASITICKNVYMDTDICVIIKEKTSATKHTETKHKKAQPGPELD